MHFAIQIGCFLLIVFLQLVAAQYDRNPCKNDGYMLPNNTCACRAYTSGKNCENMGCQRMSIRRDYQDMSRCLCGPGWYSTFCQIGGWRPPIAENLDIYKRSLIVIVNVKDTVKPFFNIFLDNINATVTKLTNSPDNTITRFTLVTFITRINGENNTDLKTFENFSDFYKQLVSIKNNAFVSTDSNFQDLIGALFFAQQRTDNTPFSEIWMLTDSLPTDNFPEDTTVAHGNIEHKLLQLAVDFRTKTRIIFCQDKDKIFDLSGDNSAHYNVIQRSTYTNHGDIFLVNQDELASLMKNVLSTYRNVEDIAAYYYLKTGTSLTFELHPDTLNETIYAIYFIDPGSASIDAPKVTVTNANIYLIDSQRYYYFYKIIGNGNGNITASVTSGVSVKFTIRCFHSTWQTVLMDYNDDYMIDFGNGIEFSGIAYSTTARPFSIDGVVNTSYIPRTSDGYPLTREIFAAKETMKNAELSTAPYFMSLWEYPCPPGPTISDIRIWKKDGSFVRRILAGYCSSSLVHFGGNATRKDEEDTKSSFKNVDQVLADNSCWQMNMDVYGDWRQWDFRQVVFVIERTTALRDADASIYALLNNSLPNWELAFSPKQYGLMVFDDQDIQVLVNNFDVQDFLKKTRVAMDGLTYKETTASRVLDAIFVATKLKLIGPMIINVITYQNSSIMPSTYNYSLVDRDTQINVFSLLSLTEKVSMYSMNDELTSLVRQSGGRYIPLKINNKAMTPQVIQSMPYEKQLIVDERAADCSSSVIYAFRVETDAVSLVILTVGYNITLNLLDANNSQISLDNKVTINSEDTKAYQFELNDTKLAKGVWTVKLQTNSGPCGLQVRIVSPYTILMGFANTSQTDFPQGQLYGARGNAKGSTAVMFRLVTQSKGSSSMRLSGVSYLGTSAQSQFTEQSGWSSVPIHQKDATSCTYQWATDVVNLPLTQLVKFIVYGSVNGTNNLLQRTFYYYQDSDLTRCRGGSADNTGKCICPTNYTGDLCQDRMCVNGGTLTWGICSCFSGFYGDFCDIPVTNGTWPTVPPHGDDLTTSMPTTTKVQVKAIQPDALLLIMFSCIIYLFR